LFLDVSDQNQN